MTSCAVSSGSREIVIAPEALRIMRSFNPSEEEKQAILNRLTTLANPASQPPSTPSGYKIAFFEPPTCRIDVGRFRIHYRIDDTKIDVGYIGVY